MHSIALRIAGVPVRRRLTFGVAVFLTTTLAAILADAASGADAPSLDAFRRNVQSGLKALGEAPEVEAIREKVANAESFRGIDEAVAPLTFATIHVNPEARVKLGSCLEEVELVAGHPRRLLLRVENLAGISAPLRLRGLDLATPDEGEAEWLRLSFIGADAGSAPNAAPLDGSTDQYLAVELFVEEPGVREFRLVADAGQGTQDLGFRATADVTLRTLTPASVDRQPLLAQVHRVAEALDVLGSPLPPETARTLEDLKSVRDGAIVARRIEEALDPLCLAVVELRPDANPVVTVGAADRALGEQSWRTYLVKVINRGGDRRPLIVESPNALPKPKSPPEAVDERWMELSAYDKQPLKRNLGGLGLEYRAIQIAGFATGRQEAELAFRIGEDGDAEGDGASRLGRVTLDFKIAPAAEVAFRVTDADGKPTVAAFEIRDGSGAVYPAQSKRLAPDFFFQRQIYRGDGESVSLPPGTYTVVCSRGPESIPETKQLVVAGGPTTLVYRERRWCDPSIRGYWSGDHHIHAAGCQHYENPTQGVHPEDMFRHIVGEDLKVGCCLTWGPCFDFQKRFFTGEVAEQSQYPYLLRYDVEVSGFGSHRSGHLNLLNLHEQIYPGGESKDHWPTLGLSTLRWAKRQGSICGPAHSANGLTRTVGRLPNAEGLDGPGGLPNFEIPAYDGIGANEFVVDVTHEVEGPDGKPVPAVDFISAMDTDRRAEWNMWYHVLNCGYRVAVSGETDFPCIYGERVGIGRVYCKIDGDLTFEKWIASLGAGRSYVSDGKCHLMEFEVAAEADRSDASERNVTSSGDELRVAGSASVRASVIAAALLDGTPEVRVELIVNGYPVAEETLVADGRERTLTFDATIEESAWVAVRTFPHAHSNPVYVVVDEAPIRADEASARWCLAGVEQCWRSKESTYAESELDAARSAYEHARQAYRRILEETTSPSP